MATCLRLEHCTRVELPELPRMPITTQEGHAPSRTPSRRPFPSRGTPREPADVGYFLGWTRSQRRGREVRTLQAKHFLAASPEDEVGRR